MNDSIGEDQGRVLVLTVGLPHSGKSSWAKTRGYPVVCPDSIRLAMHNSAFIPSAERMVWTMAHYMVQALFLSGHDCVILDAANMTRKRRDEWKSNMWKRRYKVMSTTKEECLKRSSYRPDLAPVIERMAVAFEPIALEEWDDLYIHDIPVEVQKLEDK